MLRRRLDGKPWGKGPPGGPARKRTERPARARGSWAELSLPCSGAPSVPLWVGPSQACPRWYLPPPPPHSGDPVSPLGSETGNCALTGLCRECVCVRARSHPRTRGAHTCMHTSVHTHITHACTHSLLPLRFAFAPWPLRGRLRLRRKRVWPPRVVPTWWSSQWQRHPGDRPRATQTAQGPPAGARGRCGVCRVQGMPACQPQGRKKLAVLQGPDVHSWAGGSELARLRNPKSCPRPRVLAPRLEQPQLSANLPEPSGCQALVPSPPGGCMGASKP